MALGFTSHYSQSEQPFGSLILSSTDNETAGSVAYGSDNGSYSSLLSQCIGDSYAFSVSVNIDYSQYASFGGSYSGSTETAGSVAFSGGFGGSTGGASFSGGSVSCSSGGSSGGGCSASFTC